MKKSLLAFVLAFSLVLSVAVPAFAATPADVVGKKEQSAIEELVALGIINGYADGSFKPDNNITRAELAKLIVVATGSEQAALALQNVKSQFKDVKVNEWYTGFINVAAGKGYLLGDKGTGKYRPNDNIKFEEVSAIVIRALGYQDKKLSGSWPYNVLLKAEELELFSKVDIAQGSLASRAVVAQLVNNALSKNIVEWNADAELFRSTGKKLISRLGTTYETVVSAGALANGRVVLAAGTKQLASNYIITGGKKLHQLVAHDVLVLQGTDGKIRAITDIQDEGNIVTGKLAEAFNGANGVVKVKSGTVTTNYTVGSSVYYLNGDQLTTGSIAKDLEVEVYLNAANAAVNPGLVRAVVATQYGITDGLLDSYVAATTNASARVVTKNFGAINVDENTVVTINGEVKAVTDLAANDVVELAYNNDKTALKVNATRNVVEGAVTSVTPQANGDIFFAVGGKSYKKVGTTTTPTIGATYKLFLNKDGNVAGTELLSGGTAEAKYGIILSSVNDRKETGGNYESTTTKDFFNYYSIKENKNLTVGLTNTTIGADEALAKSVVIWNLKDTDGSITGINTTIALSGAKAITDKTDSTVKVDTTVYNTNSNTVVLDATKASVTTISDRAVSVSELAKVAKGNKVVVITDGTSTYAKYIVIADKGTAATKLEGKFGLFVSANKVNTVSGSTYNVVLNVNGTETPFDLVNGDIYEAVKADLDAGGVTYKAATKTVVSLTDKIDGTSGTPQGEISSAYDTLTFGLVNTGKITNTDISNGTFKVDNAGATYYVGVNSTVFIQDTAGNVTTGNFSEVVSATIGQNDAGAADKYDFSFVVDTDADYAGFELVKVIKLIKK